jgi:hypothetical protein
MHDSGCWDAIVAAVMVSVVMRTEEVFDAICQLSAHTLATKEQDPLKGCHERRLTLHFVVYVGRRRRHLVLDEA